MEDDTVKGFSWKVSFPRCRTQKNITDQTNYSLSKAKTYLCSQYFSDPTAFLFDLFFFGPSLEFGSKGTFMPNHVATICVAHKSYMNLGRRRQMNWETSGGPGTTKTSEDRRQESQTTSRRRDTWIARPGNKLETPGKPDTLKKKWKHQR